MWMSIRNCRCCERVRNEHVNKILGRNKKDTELDIYDTPDDTKPIRSRVVTLMFLDKYELKEAQTRCGQQFVLKR